MVIDLDLNRSLAHRLLKFVIQGSSNKLAHTLALMLKILPLFPLPDLILSLVTLNLATHRYCIYIYTLLSRQFASQSLYLTSPNLPSLWLTCVLISCLSLFSLSLSLSFSFLFRRRGPSKVTTLASETTKIKAANFAEVNLSSCSRHPANVVIYLLNIKTSSATFRIKF